MIHGRDPSPLQQNSHRFVESIVEQVVGLGRLLKGKAMRNHIGDAKLTFAQVANGLFRRLVTGSFVWESANQPLTLDAG